MSGSGQHEFRILGPVEALGGGVPLPIGAGKQRAVLAVLLLNANQVVSTDKLVDDLWGGEPPETALTALQGLVSQLRKLLEPGRAPGAASEVLVTQPPGYLIRARPGQLDLDRFEQLFGEGAEALEAGRATEAAERLREALNLWRGPALADFAYEAFAQTPVARLEELRLAALELRIDADLALGRQRELAGELEALTRTHPLRERFHGQLMLALYRAGRQAEALEAFQEARRVLVDELGIDPSPALQRLEREILTQDPSLDLERARPTLPTGDLALVFTDIEGSTQLLRELGERYAEVLGDHRRLVRAAFAAHDGHEVDRQGDGFFFVFQRAPDAVAGAAACQRALADHPWPEGLPVRVRIGVHWGSPSPADSGYVGLDVHRAARICTAAHGGQVVLSAQAAELASGEGPLGAELRELGEHELKGLAEPEHLFQLLADGLPRDFPPLRTGRDEPLDTPVRSVLVVSDGDPADLVSLAEPLARSRRPHELVIASLLAPERAELLPATIGGLQAQRAALEELGATVRVAAFTSPERAADTVRLASRPEVDLLLLPGPAALLRDGELGAELAAVLAQALCHVGFLVRREGLTSPWLEGPVLVPFGAAEHDWAALELGAWLAGAASRPLRLLGTAADTEADRRDASRLLADAGLLIQRSAGVVAEPQLVGPGREGVVEAAAAGGLLVVGLSERWAQEGLGMTRWAIARTANAPVLFVRRGLRPGGLAPSGSLTRYTWSVTAPPRTR